MVILTPLQEINFQSYKIAYKSQIHEWLIFENTQEREHLINMIHQFVAFIGIGLITVLFMMSDVPPVLLFQIVFIGATLIVPLSLWGKKLVVKT